MSGSQSTPYDEDLSGPRQDFERRIYAMTDAEDRQRSRNDEVMEIARWWAEHPYDAGRKTIRHDAALMGRELVRLASLSERGTPKEDYRKCFTALVTLLPMAKAAIPHPSCTVAYAASLAQADQAIYEALHPEAPK